MSDHNEEFPDLVMPDISELYPDSPGTVYADPPEQNKYSALLSLHSTKLYKTKQMKAIKLMPPFASAKEAIEVNRGLCAALVMEWLKMMKEKAESLKSLNENQYVQVLVEYYGHILPMYSRATPMPPQEYYAKVAEAWKQNKVKDLQLEYINVGTQAEERAKSQNKKPTADQLINARLDEQMKYLMKARNFGERIRLSVPEPSNLNGYGAFWKGKVGADSFPDIMKKYIDNQKQSSGGTFVGLILPASSLYGGDDATAHAVALYCYANVTPGSKESRATFFDPNFGIYRIFPNQEREFFAQLGQVYNAAHPNLNIQIILGVG